MEEIVIFGNEVSENVNLPEVEKIMPQKVMPFLAKGNAIANRSEIEKVASNVKMKALFDKDVSSNSGGCFTKDSEADAHYTRPHDVTEATLTATTPAWLGF